MSDVRVPAARLRRPSWRDWRLVVGVLIVLMSVAVGTRVMAVADDTLPVFAATGALASGHVLAAANVKVVRAHLGGGAAPYLTARRGLPAGLVLARPVGAGELVPVAALGSPGSLTRRPVTIPVPAPLPSGLQPGASVDLWSSAKETGSSSGYRAPTRIATGAEVFAVSASGSGFSAADGSGVQVLLDESELRSALDALANGAKLAVVPAPGGIPATLPAGAASDAELPGGVSPGSVAPGPGAAAQPGAGG